jgi:hypothetical protein
MLSVDFDNLFPGLGVFRLRRGLMGLGIAQTNLQENHDQGKQQTTQSKRKISSHKKI